jgi:hypothetical protein
MGLRTGPCSRRWHPHARMPACHGHCRRVGRADRCVLARLQELRSAFGTDAVKSPYLRASTVIPTSASAHKPVSAMRGTVAAALAADYDRRAKWLTEEWPEMALERRSSLAHATDSRSLADALVAAPATTPPEAPAPAPAAVEPRVRRPKAAAPVAEGEPAQTAPAPASQVEYRRGPGRPRNERIMRPLTTTIEIGLRARVDEYVAEHNAKFVDVLDQALRLALDVWEGKVEIRDDAGPAADSEVSR